jgi:hypothetical protein
VKFAFIAKQRGIWPAGWLCGALGVSRGGFHAWLTRPRSQRGLWVVGAGTEIIRAAQSMVTGNTHGWNVGGSRITQSYGDNYIDNN